MEIEVRNKKRLYNFLAELESVPMEITLYLMSDSFLENFKKLSWPEPISDTLKTIVNDENVIKYAEKYDTGAIIFLGELGEKGIKNYVILPPFPIQENKSSFGFDPSFLYQGFDQKLKRGVVLVRWGEYAIGVFDGDKLIEFKTGTGYIQKAHKKGGRSQARYARRTQEQKQDFIRKVGNRIDERFKPLQPDYLFFGGNRLILNPLLKESDYLQHNSDKISKRILEAKEAKFETLVNILEEIEKSIVFSF